MPGIEYLFAALTPLNILLALGGVIMIPIALGSVIALTIFALWNPMRAILGAFLFGGIFVLQYLLQPLGISPNFLAMLPYLATLLVLLVGGLRDSRRLNAPAMLAELLKVDEERAQHHVNFAHLVTVRAQQADHLAGLDSPRGSLQLYEGASGSFRAVKIPKRPGCPACG